ncbi:hypothetical protein ABZ840_37590 [Streptomyces sp. NPDC047117]|uniref:hypothetical protein n=1 Tax=Streptomyces sp. NPDC047117 TaxID=3155379 RepID=UPI0033D995DB
MLLVVEFAVEEELELGQLSRRLLKKASAGSLLLLLHLLRACFHSSHQLGDGRLLLHERDVLVVDPEDVDHGVHDMLQGATDADGQMSVVAAGGLDVRQRRWSHAEPVLDGVDVGVLQGGRRTHWGGIGQVLRLLVPGEAPAGVLGGQVEGVRVVRRIEPVQCLEDRRLA